MSISRKQKFHQIIWERIHSFFLSSNLNATLDGTNRWHELITNRPTNYTKILHNIDDIWGSAALSVGEWKVVKGTNYGGQWDYWYGPAGNRSPAAYKISDVAQSPAGAALHYSGHLPSAEVIS